MNLRQWTAAPKKDWLIAVFVAATVLLVAYQVPYAYFVDADSMNAEFVLGGFRAVERTHDLLFRWSGADSTITFNGVVPNQAYELRLRLSAGPRPGEAPPPQVTLTANNLPLPTFDASRGWSTQRYLLKPSCIALSPDLTIAVHVPTFRPSQFSDEQYDSRALGVMLARAVLAPSGPPVGSVRLPPFVLWPPWMLSTLLWFAWVRRSSFCRDPRTRWGLFALGLVVVAAGLALQRILTLAFLWYVLLGLGLAFLAPQLSSGTLTRLLTIKRAKGTPVQASAPVKCLCGSMVSVAALLAYGLCIWLDLPAPGTVNADGMRWWVPMQGLRGWAGTQGGWVWPLIAPPAPPDRWLLLVSAALGGAIVLRRLRQRPAFALLLLVLLGYVAMLGGLWLKEPNPMQLLFDRVVSQFTGFFSTATRVEDAHVFFDGFADALRGGRLGIMCNHCMVHPPGPILWYWSLIALLKAMPADLTRALWAVVATRLDLNVPTRLPPAEALAALLGGNLTLLGAALVVIPLYGLARRVAGQKWALGLAAFGLVIPGFILMAPTLDQVSATASAVLFYLVLRGLSTDRRNALWGVVGGLWFALCLYGSYAIWVLVIPILMLTIMVWSTPRMLFSAESQSATPHPAIAQWLAGMAVGGAAPWLATWWIGHLDLPAVLALSLADQAKFDATRPYWPWVLFNLTDFLQFSGLPLVVVVLSNLFAHASRIDPGKSPARFLDCLPFPSPWVHSFASVFIVSFIIVDAVGVARGETGRLWLFMVPLALMALYQAVGRGELGRHGLLGLAVAQFLVMTVIGIRWYVP